MYEFSLAAEVRNLRQKYRRYRLISRIGALHRHRQYFDEQVRAGLSAMRYIDREIAKAESDFRRMK